MSQDSVKLSIKLTHEQIGSFPVSVESIWFDKEGTCYRVKNIPQFIDNLSFNDLVSIRPLKEGLFEIENIVEPSLNSTIWALAKSGHDIQLFLNALKSLGCGIEGGALDGYYSINIPEYINIEDVYSLVDQAEELAQLVADYPSIRQ
jgi:hypothetical protein